jgi:chromosome condensin MukBEF ATPase and DNA-binding subunit MukB
MGDDMERRLTVLEIEHKHMVEAVDKMSRKVDEMHTLLTKARGGWWLLLGVFTVGGFIAGKLGALVPFVGVK